MMDIIADMPSNVAAVSVQGQVTGDDYDKVLTPLVVEKLKDHDKVRLLFHMVTIPSNPSPPVTVSMESAITSRETSE